MKRSSRVVGFLSIVACSAVASAACATDYPVFASQLTLRNRNGKSSSSLVLPRLGYSVPVPGGADDPSITGMTLTVISRGTGETSTFQAAAGSGKNSWKVRATPKGPAYGFNDATASTVGDDIHTVSFRSNKLKLQTRAAGLALAVPQGAVAVRVEYGSVRICALFGGVKTDLPGFFNAHGGSADALADCDDATLAGTP